MNTSALTTAYAASNVSGSWFAGDGSANDQPRVFVTAQDYFSGDSLPGRREMKLTLYGRPEVGKSYPSVGGLSNGEANKSSVFLNSWLVGEGSSGVLGQFWTSSEGTVTVDAFVGRHLKLSYQMTGMNPAGKQGAGASPTGTFKVSGSVSTYVKDLAPAPLPSGAPARGADDEFFTMQLTDPTEAAMRTVPMVASTHIGTWNTTLKRVSFTANVVEAGFVVRNVTINLNAFPEAGKSYLVRHATGTPAPGSATVFYSDTPSSGTPTAQYRGYQGWLTVDDRQGTRLRYSLHGVKASGLNVNAPGAATLKAQGELLVKDLPRQAP